MCFLLLKSIFQRKRNKLFRIIGHLRSCQHVPNRGCQICIFHPTMNCYDNKFFLTLRTNLKSKFLISIKRNKKYINEFFSLQIGQNPNFKTTLMNIICRILKIMNLLLNLHNFYVINRLNSI